MGLFGSSHSAPVQAAPAGPPQAPRGLGAAGTILDALLSGGLVTSVQRGNYKREASAYAAQQAQEKVAKMAALAEQLNLDPREKLVMMSNPDAWAKENATRYGFHDVTGGHTMLNGPGGQQTMAPSLVSDNGVYGTQTENGYTQTGARGPSIIEQESAAQNALKNILARQKFDWQKKYEGGTLGVSQGNLGVRRAEYGARLKGVGGFGTPGVGNVMGAQLPSGWEEVK